MRVERQVADLAGVAVPAGEDVPVDADPRADTGGDGEVHHVVGVAVGVEPLADDAGVRVVVQVHLVRLQQHREGTGQRDAVDGVREVRRVFDDTFGQSIGLVGSDTGGNHVCGGDVGGVTGLPDRVEDRLRDRVPAGPRGVSVLCDETVEPVSSPIRRDCVAPRSTPA